MKGKYIRVEPELRGFLAHPIFNFIFYGCLLLAAFFVAMAQRDVFLKIFFIFSFIVYLYFSFCWWQKNRKIVFLKRDVYKKIQHLINYNNFGRKTSKIEDGKEVLCWVHYPEVYFLCSDGNKVEIIWVLDGSKESLEYRNLGQRLVDLFGMPLAEKRELDVGAISYILDDTRGKQIIIESNEGIEGSVNRKEQSIALALGGIVWNLVQSPHALIVGGTGSGKTYVISYLFRALFDGLNSDIRVIDPKNSDLSKIAEYYDCPCAVSSAQACGILRQAVEEMERRYFQFREIAHLGFSYTETSLSSCCIIIDEYIDLMALAGKKEKEEIGKYLTSLLVKGRQAGVFVILGMQRCDAKILPGEIREQFGLRIAMGRDHSSESLRMIFPGHEVLRGKDYQIGCGYVYYRSNGDNYLDEPLYCRLPIMKDFKCFLKCK